MTHVRLLENGDDQVALSSTSESFGCQVGSRNASGAIAASEMAHRVGSANGGRRERSSGRIGDGLQLVNGHFQELGQPSLSSAGSHVEQRRELPH